MDSEPEHTAKTTRSLSDGTPDRPKLSPSPLILEQDRRTSKDDSAIRMPTPTLPVTPCRSAFPPRGAASALSSSLNNGALAAALGPHNAALPSASNHSPHIKPAPLSPKLDHSHIYSSPSSALPRRSRGLDFSRAATSLHHSTLAEQSSPDSSPTGRAAMNIPLGAKRLGGDFGAAETSSTSLWSIMGNQEKMHISSSVGSTVNHLASDLSSSSDDDDLMDDVMDEPYITTPNMQSRTTHVPGPAGAYSPSPGHLAGPLGINNLLSFQQLRRPRKQPKRKKLRGPIGLGFSSIAGTSSGLGVCKSPPNSFSRDSGSHSRRESISWAANQLNLSGNESDESMRPIDSVEGVMGTSGRDGQNGQQEVIRRVVTRRGNLLPKTKAFARMRAVLAEEHAPVDNEVRREAEVVRQVRDSDMEHHRRPPPPPLSVTTTALSSPTLGLMHDVDDVDDAMVVDTGGAAGGTSLSLSTGFKQHAARTSRVPKNFWDTFSESSSMGGAGGTTPPPPALLARGSSSAMSVNNDDMTLDSPSTSSGPTPAMIATGGIFPMSMTTRSSSGGDTPQTGGGGGAMGAPTNPNMMPPTAAEITRRINNKRRRDDDLDPISFKRRAVSPSLSAHNSPIMQSPLQRDLPWGSRPGSNGHDRPGGSASESGGSQQGARVGGNKGRFGYQGMADTNDGITKLSID